MAPPLAQELVDMIVGHLARLCDDDNVYLAAYAVISRTWQRAVEAILFKEIALTFQDIKPGILLLLGTRSRYVRRLRYALTVPSIPPVLVGLTPRKAVRGEEYYAPYPEYYPLDQQMFGQTQKYSESLSEGVWWSHSKVNPGYWCVRFDSSRDFFRHMTVLLGLINSFWNLKSLQSLEQLEIFFWIDDEPVGGKVTTEAELKPSPASWTLPTTPGVRSLRLYGNRPAYNLSSMWMPRVRSAMPALAELRWTFEDENDTDHDEPDYYTYSSARSNHCFSALNALDVGHLQVLKLGLPLDGSAVSHAGVDNSAMRRSYSDNPQLVLINAALRKISTQLRVLEIRGYLHLTPDLFSARPGYGDDEPIENLEEPPPPQPSWPRLETLKIILDGEYSPEYERHQFFHFRFAGNWYSHEGPDADFDQRGFWIARQWAEFGELIVAMSRAMLRMPRLERMAVTTTGWASYEPYEALPGPEQSVDGRVELYPPTCAFYYDIKTAREKARPGSEAYKRYEPLDRFFYHNLQGHYWHLRDPDANDFVRNDVEGKDVYLLNGPDHWEVPEEALENWQELCRRITGYNHQHV